MFGATDHINNEMKLKQGEGSRKGNLRIWICFIIITIMIWWIIGCTCEVSTTCFVCHYRSLLPLFCSLTKSETLRERERMLLIFYIIYAKMYMYSSHQCNNGILMMTVTKKCRYVMCVVCLPLFKMVLWEKMRIFYLLGTWACIGNKVQGMWLWGAYCILLSVCHSFPSVFVLLKQVFELEPPQNRTF